MAPWGRWRHDPDDNLLVGMELGWEAGGAESRAGHDCWLEGGEAGGWRRLLKEGD